MQVGDTIWTTKIVWTEGTRISDGEIVDVSLERMSHFQVVTIGNERNGGKGCVEIDTRRGIHVWLDADCFSAWDGLP